MKARTRLSDESGFTLVELLVVLAIMGIVLAALTQLFVAAMRTEVDQSKRFQAQQETRLALDGLRREIHCASSVTLENGSAVILPNGTTGTNYATARVNLGPYCDTSGGAAVSVRWCTTGSASRYSLIRTSAATCTGGVKKADYLTTGLVFTNLDHPAGSQQRAKLGVRLPVDVDPAAAGGLYELRDDIVLRNSARS